MKTRLTIFMGILCLKAFSQTSPGTTAFETPNFAPKTPEAAAFLKYGEYPVDLSTGVPNISIPLYTVETAAFKLPISLDYHASGIKVTQEATWVGLGWNLNCGAQIILSVRDDVDESNPFVYDMPDVAALEDYYDFHVYQFNGGPVNSQSLDRSRIKDTYSFSSPTANGSFYIRNRTTQDIVIFPPDAFKVEITGTSGGFHFKITDTSGNQYLFNNTRETSVRTMTHGDSYVSAWYVDEIRTPANNSILFTYQDDIQYNEFSTSQRVDVKELAPLCECPGENVKSFTTTGVITSNSTTMTTPKKIHEITFNDGHSKVEFTMHDGREDMISGNSYLQKIEIKQSESGNFITKKGYTFEYSYFQPSVGSGFTYKDKRLRLDRIATIIEGNAHDFVYDTTFDLPSKDSFAQDYFGYFNDHGGLDMIPRHYISTPYNLFVGQANKTVNPNSLKAGMLTEIHYPTKGWTKFLYEANQYFGVDQFDRYTEHTVPDVHTISGYGTPTSDPVETPTIDESFPADCQDTPTDGCVRYGYFPFHAINALGSISFQGDTHGQTGSTAMHYKYWRVRVFNGDGSTAYDTAKKKLTTSLFTESGITLNGDCYILTEAYGDQIDVYAELHFMNDDPTPKNLLGGGLRVASIENYNYDDVRLLKKVFEYIDWSNPLKSSGKLVNDLKVSFTTNPIANVSIINCPNPLPNGGGGTTFGASYQNVYSVTSSSRYGIESNSVVYEYVNERLIGNEEESNGLTKYKFTTTADEIPWGDPTVVIASPWRRGKVLDKFVYKTVGTDDYLVRHEINKYIEDPAKVSFIDGFKMFRHSIVPGVDERDDAAWIPPYPYELLMGVCYVPGNVDESFEFAKLHLAIPWFHIKETKIVEKFYDDANNLQDSIITVKEFKYENPLHQELTRETSRSSVDEITDTKYFYPQDAAMSLEPHIQDLIANNMVAVPLKIETYRAGNKLAEKLTRYAKDSTTANLVLPKFIYTKKGISVSASEKRLTYDKYDAHGNLLQYTPEGGHPVSIIWGYHYTQPVAKIENCSYASISSSIVSAIESATDTGTETQAINALQQLRGDASMAGSMVSTFTYVPLFGVSTVTDPKGIATKYEYDNEGRLVRVKDHDQNILSENEYHFKN